MSWTVMKMDERGQKEKALSSEFEIEGFDNLDSGKFKLIKYLDPYGDSTFGRTQFDDLTSDLKQLEKSGRVKTKQMHELIGLINECKHDVHTYLKFLGD
jgi:hypothetical protein